VSEKSERVKRERRRREESEKRRKEEGREREWCTEMSISWWFAG
jgi:hypothetical protein